GLGELGADPSGEFGGLGAGRVALRAADELGPRERGGDVVRRQLPDRALCPLQAADEETVDADQLARPLSGNVPLRLRLAQRLVRRRVAGNQGPPPCAGVGAPSTHAAPDAGVAYA